EAAAREQDLPCDRIQRAEHPDSQEAERSSPAPKTRDGEEDRDDGQSREKRLESDEQRRHGSREGQNDQHLTGPAGRAAACRWTGRGDDSRPGKTIARNHGHPHPTRIPTPRARPTTPRVFNRNFIREGEYTPTLSISKRPSGSIRLGIVANAAS